MSYIVLENGKICNSQNFQFTPAVEGVGKECGVFDTINDARTFITRWLGGKHKLGPWIEWVNEFIGPMDPQHHRWLVGQSEALIIEIIGQENVNV